MLYLGFLYYGLHCKYYFSPIVKCSHLHLRIRNIPWKLQCLAALNLTASLYCMTLFNGLNASPDLGYSYWKLSRDLSVLLKIHSSVSNTMVENSKTFHPGVILAGAGRGALVVYFLWIWCCLGSAMSPQNQHWLSQGHSQQWDHAVKSLRDFFFLPKDTFDEEAMINICLT